MHRISATVLLALTLAAVWGCACDAGRPEGLPPNPAIDTNTVRMYLTSPPASMSLIGKTDYNGEILALQLTDTLIQFDEHLDYQPRLAESWEIAPDRRTVTFKLRPGVRWHDGQPVTADDIVFTIRKVVDPAVENRTWGSLLKELDSVEAPDERTVRATFAKGMPDLLESFRVPILPRHLAGKDPDLLTGEFARHPVGCGPFRFVRSVPGQEIVLEANDDYWDGRPHIDRLIFKFYPDQRTAYQALLTSELDIMAVSANLWDEARRSEQAKHVGSKLYQRFNAWTLGWNLSGGHPALSDARVRRALVLALDRRQFIDSVVHGLARPGITTFHPASKWADPELEPWPYDPEEAKRLLDEAGWTDEDGDGLRENEGRPLRFTLISSTGGQQLKDQMAAWQQESWNAIGARVEIERLEWQAFRERRNNGHFDVVAGTFLFGPMPDEQFDLYHSSARGEGFNFWGVNDPEIDRLLEQGRGTFEFEPRREAYRQLQRRLHDQETFTVLFYFDSPLIHDKRLEGVVPMPLGYANSIRGPREWRWSAAGSGP